MLERLGSLDAEMIREVADRHGLTLTLGPTPLERVPVRKSAVRRCRVGARRFARGDRRHRILA